jgi:hypothetical protein
VLAKALLGAANPEAGLREWKEWFDGTTDKCPRAR